MGKFKVCQKVKVNTDTELDNIDKKLHISDSSNFIKWGKIFDDMKTSPYIDIKQVRECDRIAIFTWLSSNFHAPIKKDKQLWD